VVFEIGLEDGGGNLAWAGSEGVGGVPRPFDQLPGSTKSMMSTLRFPVRCFEAENAEFRLREILATLIRFDSPRERSIGFDVLQIVKERP
jgi:hypothetical protein